MLFSFLINNIFLKLVWKSVEKALSSQELIALTQIRCFPNERNCIYFQAVFEYLCSGKECLPFPWITFFLGKPCRRTAHWNPSGQLITLCNTKQVHQLLVWEERKLLREILFLFSCASLFRGTIALHFTFKKPYRCWAYSSPKANTFFFNKFCQRFGLFQAESSKSVV